MSSGAMVVIVGVAVGDDCLWGIASLVEAVVVVLTSAGGSSSGVQLLMEC